jgi:hypothetical protein
MNNHTNHEGNQIMNTAAIDTVDSVDVELPPLDRDELASASGGLATPPHQDFAHVYGTQVKNDLIDLGGREHAAVNDFKAHHYMTGIKDTGAAVLDDAKTLADAVLPIKALKFW